MSEPNPEALEARPRPTAEAIERGALLFQILSGPDPDPAIFEDAEKAIQQPISSVINSKARSGDNSAENEAVDDNEEK